MAVEYGRDLACVTDLTYGLHEVQNDRQGVAQAIAHRLQTQVLFYDPDYGYDMRRLLNAATLEGMAGQVESRVEEEALKDERVQFARAVVQLVDEKLTVRIRLVTYEFGPFDLTLTVSELTVEALRVT